MAMGQYFEEAFAHSDFDGDAAFAAKHRNSDPDAVSVSDDNSSGNFDCNICLEPVQDPVVTLCGHLYCWPCIYKWFHLQSISTNNEDQRHKQCPVCKAEVSYRTLVPLYGRGQTTIQGEGKEIPRRPLGPVYRLDMPQSPYECPNLRLSQRVHLNYPHRTRMYYPQQDGFNPVMSAGMSYSTVLDPVIGMFGEMVCARLFGSQVTDSYTYPDAYNLAGRIGPRMRRQMMQADKSLGRICLFLMCCVVLCLLLF